MRTAIFSLVILMVGLTIAPVQAQSELSKEQMAVMSFDLRFDMIRNCDLAKSLNLEDQMSAWAEAQDDDGPDPTKISRVWGAMSAPEDMEAAQGLAVGQLPMEFYVKIKFIDEAAADEMMDQVKKDESPSFEKDGKTYYRPPEDEQAPEGMCMHRLDPTTIEFGTDAYIFHSNQKVFSDGLSEAWSKVPKGAFRMALDLKGAEGLIGDAVEFGKPLFKVDTNR